MKRRRHHSDEETKIGDIYEIHGEHPIIALVDPHHNRLYVAERAIDRVKAALRVTEVKESQWLLQHAELKGEYSVSAIENLDLNLPLLAGMAAVNEKSKCDKTSKGECSNMYDDKDNFIYSWKAPKDLWQCEWSKEQDCTEIWKDETIDVYF